MNGEPPVLALTRELITRPSVTPNDAGCLELIEQRLRPLGFETVRLRHGEVDNLWAVRGRSGPCLAFAGHTDVVPPGDIDAWRTPPFEAVLLGDMLHGRGAADMKGSLAAMVTAVERLLARRSELAGRLAFILTSDEEGPAIDGTVRVMEYLQRERIEVDWCVVGEPSSAVELGDTVRVGRRGSLNGHLQVHGTQGHVAYPDRADNPIHRSLAALEALTSRHWDNGNDYYPPSSFQISNVRGGAGAENVIPGELDVWFNFRFSTEHDEAGLCALVESILDEHGLDYRIDWRLSGAPFLTPGGRLVETVQAVVRERCGVDPELSTGGGTSDGRFIAPRGIEVVELGPNNSTIHKIDECVAVSEIERLSEVYEDIAERMLGD